MKLFLITTAVILRIFVFWISIENPEGCYSNDSQSYFVLAQNLEKHQIFSQTADTPETFRVPGYPVFAAFFLKAGFTRNTLPVAQGIFFCLIPVLFYFFSQKILEKKSALFCTLLFSADLSYITYSCYVLSDILFSAFFIVFCILFFTGMQKNKDRYILFSAIVLGLCTYIRAISIYMAFIAAIFYLVSSSHKLNRKILFCTLFLSAFFLVLFPWKLRNSTEGQFRFSSADGINLLYYRAAGIYMRIHNTTFSDTLPIMADMAGAPHGTKISAFKQDALFRKMAISYITKHPFTFAAVWIKGIFDIYRGPGKESLFRLAGKKWKQGFREFVIYFLLILYECMLIFVYYSATAGFYKACKNKNRLMIFLLITILYFTAVSSQVGAYARFRIPVMPFLYLAVGYFVEQRRKYSET